MPLGCGVGKTWCADLRVVTVPLSAPKPVTLVYPFYRSQSFLARQAAVWRSYTDDLASCITVIVVDDGSPEPATLPETGVSSRLFRIEQDVPWNWLAARNIGAHHAEDGWLLLTDMDHVVPEATLRAVVYGQHDPSVVYAFSRREHTGETIHSHSASFLMTREMFWRIGGYDERLSGVYGTDGAYRKRLRDVSPVYVLADALVRHEYVDDASVTTYERKTPAMRHERARRFARVRGGTPLTLSFPYHEVAV